MRQNRPTIIDVAERAGASKSLVSLVMRGSSNVSEERRRAVLKAAEELGYRPNAAARSLVRNRSHILGVMVSDFHNPFFAEVLDGVEDAATSADYRALFNTGIGIPDRERQAVETLLQLRTDGVILAGPRIPDDVIAKLAKEVPLVVVGQQMDITGLDVVTNDDRLGASLAVDHLVELGHCDIAHIDGGEGAGAADRRTGYVATMRRHGLTPKVVPGAFNEAGGAKGVTQLAEGRMPTAIFTGNDFAAVAAMQTLDDLGYSIPSDVALVGYDNIAVAALGHIGLTTIDQPRREMGAIAVEMLIERLDGGRQRRRRLVVEPSLVIRTTT